MADNGQIAVDLALTAKAEGEPYDVILMDMQMPNMNGTTAVRAMRSKGLEIPIYALTADETTEAVIECKEAGCNGHLSKPLDSAQLKSLIENLQSKLSSNTTNIHPLNPDSSSDRHLPPHHN